MPYVCVSFYGAKGESTRLRTYLTSYLISERQSKTHTVRVTHKVHNNHKKMD